MSKRPSKSWYGSVTIWYNAILGLAALVACGFADTPLEGSLFLSAFLVCGANITLRLLATTDIE